MAIRRWAVRPDRMLELAGGDAIAYCSRDAMREAFLDGEALMAQAGGVFSVVSYRARTDLEGEMVTISAVCEWKDRADARPQPEAAAPTAPVPPDVEDEFAAAAAELAAAAGEQPEPEDEERDAGDDPDEDLASIPEHLRAKVA